MPALVLLVSGQAAVAFVQEPAISLVRYPALPRIAANAAGFVPAGWTIIASRRGDLNGDGAADLVLLLRMRDPANVLAIPSGEATERFDTNPHLLAIAFADPRNGYRLAASSHGLFLRPIRPWTGDGPPGADTVGLERGDLVMNFTFLRGWSKYRFRWQAGRFRLTGYDSVDASGGCIGSVGINYLTGRARLAKSPTSSDRDRVEWRRLRSNERPTLDRIDLETFTPEMAIAGPPLPCPPPGDE